MATQVAPDTLPGGAGSAAAHDPTPVAGRRRGGSGRSPPTSSSATTAGSRSRGTRRRRAVEELANGLLALGVRKGDAFGILGQTSLEWALFDFALAHVGAIGAAIYANSAREGLRVHPRPLGVGRRARRGRRAAREARRLPDANPRLEHVLTFARPRRAARARARIRGWSTRASSPRRPPTVEPGRRLHLHLHVRHDRPAEGLHDPPPQLLRDGGGRRRDRRLHDGRRHDAALPPARAQLRPADAPAGPVRRLHARVPSRPAARRRGAEGGPADALPERAARLREGPHGGAREVRRGDRREAEDRRLGARRRPQGVGAPRGGRSRSARSSARSTASPTASSTRR